MLLIVILMPFVLKRRSVGGSEMGGKGWGEMGAQEKNKINK